MKPNDVLSTILNKAVVEDIKDIVGINVENLIIHDFINYPDKLKMSVEFKYKNKYYFKNFEIIC